MLEKIIVGPWTDIILKYKPTSFHCRVHFSSLMNWYAQHIAVWGEDAGCGGVSKFACLTVFSVQSFRYSTCTCAAQG